MSVWSKVLVLCGMSTLLTACAAQPQASLLPLPSPHTRAVITWLPEEVVSEKPIWTEGNDPQAFALAYLQYIDTQAEQAGIPEVDVQIAVIKPGEIVACNGAETINGSDQNADPFIFCKNLPAIAIVLSAMTPAHFVGSERHIAHLQVYADEIAYFVDPNSPQLATCLARQLIGSEVHTGQLIDSRLLPYFPPILCAGS